MTTDQALEQSIQETWIAFRDAETRAERIAAFRKMDALIKQRSPRQIARMEKAKELVPNQPVVVKSRGRRAGTCSA